MHILTLALSLLGAPVCKPASGAAAAALRRAADVMGLSRTNGRVLRLDATDIISHDYESDRPYAPPYLMQASRFTEWFDASTGADRVTTTESMIGGYQYGGGTTLGARTASYGVRDTTLVPSPPLHSQLDATRPLNVWALVADWTAAGDARISRICDVRDYPRLVLTRSTDRGEEQLYLDQKTGYPAGYARREEHYLWGKTDVEYVFATWKRAGDAHVPGSATRMVEGAPEITRSFGGVDLIPSDSAPRTVLPPNASPMPRPIAAFLAPSAPDTIRVSANTVLLRNPGYQETLTLAHDTV